MWAGVGYAHIPRWFRVTAFVFIMSLLPLNGYGDLASQAVGCGSRESSTAAEPPGIGEEPSSSRSNEEEQPPSESCLVEIRQHVCSGLAVANVPAPSRGFRGIAL